MKIIAKQRRNGKTTELIKLSAETNTYILVANKKRQKEVMELANLMNINILYPVTVEDYIRTQFRGSFIKNILIDDAEDVLQAFFYTVAIDAITITTARTSCEDTISKTEVINTIHETIYGFFDIADDGSEEPMNDKDKLLLTINKAISNAVKALPSVTPKTKSCEDCISREDAINVVHKYFVNYLKLNDDICLDGIRSLPPVTPSRPKGKWVHWTDDYKDYVTCSCCEYGEEGEVLLSDKTPFCPICGADMR